MSQLVQRYFRDKDSAASAESDIDGLKLEIADLRQAINDLLERR
jgi:hypothetical protein